MHRAPLLALLADYAERYPDEQTTVTRLRDFVEANVDCFERSLLAGHITGSAWLLDSGGDRALLTHHRKLGRWLQPGGHADGEADVANVAMREAMEESGIDDVSALSDQIFDIDIHEIPARGEEPAHFHYDCRFLLQAAHDDYVVSEESNDLRWIGADDMTTLTDEESVLRMVRKWRILQSTG
ncbi:MAG: NUDIX hydrolase [Pseudomonadota bacterium]